LKIKITESQISKLPNHQFSLLLLFVIMADANPNLDRFLHAIADPTRRRILRALTEKGGCSIDKGTGLCAFDIEQRCNWRSLRFRITCESWKRRAWSSPRERATGAGIDATKN
jgi:hypothetical protein